MKSKNNFVEIGEIGPAHGLHGGVFVVCFDRRSEIGNYQALIVGEIERKIVKSLTVSGKLVVHFDAIATRTEAEKLKAQKVFVPKEVIRVDEGEVLIGDLVGSHVFSFLPDNSEILLGKIISVQNFGAQDTLEIEYSQELKTLNPKINHSTFYFPYLDEFVEKNELESKKLFVKYQPEFWNLA